ncbi:GTP-binding protein [Dyella amyloliquefaciens]|uniref:GTP-binding protein n=1 Tax=Dyella amyloliquefaciens TaxID=1770545 RepID=UPI00102E79D9|nr:ATP/GTP-binding protein [Dyella amyloliquefaciens]
MDQREYKLIFTGSMGAGKTTAIAAVSEVAPLCTDVQNTDHSEFAKATTTTGLDYGEVTLPGGQVLRLFGTPGQTRFRFMWDILGKGALGVVVLVDNSRPDPVRDACDYVQAFSNVIAGTRAVIGVGRCDAYPTPTLEEYDDALKAIGVNVPVISADVRQREHVLTLVDILFYQIEAAETVSSGAVA